MPPSARYIGGLLVGTLLVAATACDSEDRSTSERMPAATNDTEERSPTDAGPAIPRVPRGPAPADSPPSASDVGRECLRRAAGIDGWRNYLLPWAASAHLPVDVPDASADRPLNSLPLIGLDRRGASLESRRLTSSVPNPPDADGGSWSRKALRGLASRLRERAAGPLTHSLRAAGATTSDAGSREVVQIAAAADLRPSTVATFAAALSEAPVLVDLVVRDPGHPPPVEQPRPRIAWIEEMIATWERTDSDDIRRQVFNDAVERAAGSCNRLRVALRDFFDTPLQTRREVELPTAVAGCDCNEIAWRPVESLAVWGLQPLGPRLGSVRTALDELRRTDATTIEGWLASRTP